MAVAAPESTLSTIQRVTGTQVSKVTINGRLKEWNLRARRPCVTLPTLHTRAPTIFSDESRFLLCPDDRRKHVWRRPGQRVDPSLTVEHHTGPQQGGMVWGAISFESRNPLVVIPGTLTTQRSPDLSPIEHIRDVMGRRLQPSPNVDYLARQLETSWQEIPQHTIRNLYQSMTRRVAACIQASGGPTTY
ncbi:Transposase [Cordylochernes scorpioides]|uniref:Transposase n=1 Tax=Cordylochernes scorpioides TaxID=51811 RepID=A0ABY6KMZ0_9ARAC|nr:Transposase [Cordylochernes scorpioides]